MRIVIRGGSIAAGYGVRSGYVDILKAFQNPARHNILNRSRIGETSFDGINTFYEDIESLKPEVLILHFGIDDAFRAVYRSEFKENMVHIIRLASDSCRPDIVLITSHLLPDPREMEAIDIFNRVIREIAVDLECTMIPVHTYWAGYLYQNRLALHELLQDDPRYPNEQGHRVYAEAVGRWLSNRFGA